jgi:chromosome segregation protein
MYLKRLELLGFKSFAQKTTLDFPSGVTAIVGPNGSGKSNIIDAMRWVLGETSAKNLRADKAENLIYSGTSQRVRSGFAQVSITFDNSNNFFPVDFKEVTIRRRVNRDSASTYFLNESEVRLKDIVDFFSKARLGTKGFSIINQGNSDLFIKAGPKDRRVMLEEVLGLRQYQIKRQEAENKLQATKFNLEKTGSLAEEILPHLRVLRRQTNKWQKYDELQAELESLEQKYFGSKLAELEKQEKELAPKIAEFDNKIEQIKKELSIREKKLSEVEKNQPQSNTDFNKFKSRQSEILNRKSTIAKELGRLEAEMDFLLRQPKENIKESQLLEIINNTQKLIQELLQLENVEIIKQRLTGFSNDINKTLNSGSDSLKVRQNEIKSLSDRLTEELSLLEKDLTALSGEEEKLAGNLRDFNALFKEAFSLVEEKKNELLSTENQRNQILFDKEKINIHLKDLEHQANQANRKLSEFKNSNEELNLNLNEIEKRLLQVRGELATIGEIDPLVIKEAKEMEERYNFLSSQVKDLESASEDLKNLINELKIKIHDEFMLALKNVNHEFNEHFKIMFSGGKAKLNLTKDTKTPSIANLVDGEAIEEDLEKNENNLKDDERGLEIEISIPRKNIKNLDMLSGGERSLVSIAVLFALISVSPPPFLVLDEIDAALDENNTRRFSDLIKSYSEKSQFLLVTHNRATMNSASVLYGVTMNADGTSRLLSIKLDEVANLKMNN